MVRIKHRYLLVNILYPSKVVETPKTEIPDAILFHAPTPAHVTASGLLHLLRAQVSLLFGDYGSGVLAAGLTIKYFSNATSTAIIRCPRAHYRLAWAALTFVTQLPTPRKGMAGEDCVLRVIRVSGTIKKVEQEAVRRARRMISSVAREGDTSATLDNVFGIGDHEDGVENIMDEEDMEMSE